MGQERTFQNGLPYAFALGAFRAQNFPMADDPNKPEQEALFYIEGPDERGCVWMHSTSSRDPWSQNLGPRDKVAEVLSQWLGSIGCDEADLSA